MSLSLANTWVRTAIRHPGAQADALRLLDRAAASNSEATLIAGCELTTNGRTYLGRWDGRELVVLELPTGLQRIWGIDPQALVQQMEAPAIATPILTSEPVVTISNARVDERPWYSGDTALLGTCRYEFDGPKVQIMLGCALRAEYFRPNLPHQNTAMWYLDEPLWELRGSLHFGFPPPLAGNRMELAGTVLLFLQMFDSDDWAKNVGTRRVSNVTPVLATLRPSVPPSSR